MDKIRFATYLMLVFGLLALGVYVFTQMYVISGPGDIELTKLQYSYTSGISGWLTHLNPYHYKLVLLTRENGVWRSRPSTTNPEVNIGIGGYWECRWDKPQIGAITDILIFVLPNHYPVQTISEAKELPLNFNAGAVFTKHITINPGQEVIQRGKNENTNPGM